MRKYRKFSADFKAEQVLALLAGSKTAAEICREYDLKPQVLSNWKAEFLAKAPSVFQSLDHHSDEQARIAELERLVGRADDATGNCKKSLAALAPRPAVKRSLIEILSARYPVQVICDVLNYRAAVSIAQVPSPMMRNSPKFCKVSPPSIRPWLLAAHGGYPSTPGQREYQACAALDAPTRIKSQKKA